MSTILMEVKNGVALITFNREEKRNAFNREMAFELQHALDRCRDDQAIRAVMISGKGSAFSAGQDLAEVASPNGVDLEKILPEQLNPIIVRIRNLPLPVVAAVNGIAAGAGANIALCCDFVVAASSAVFIQAFTRIGLIPDSGGTYFLPRLIGWQKASALMMLADKVSAAEAESMGMIYKTFADEQFSAESYKLAQRLALMPTKALALTKDALNHSAGNNFETQLSYEDKLQAVAGKSKDFSEGMRAFIEKREPVFTGK